MAERATDHESGAQLYRSALASGLRPDPVLTVSEWADRYRQLSRRSSQTTGPWRTSLTPYLREPMDALSASSKVELLVFMKGSQVGGTELLNNWLGYTIHHQPGPFLLVMPSEKVQRRKSRQTLEALIDDTPVLREKVRESRESSSSLLMKTYPGGMLVQASAESPSDLRSMSARYLGLDELDAYPDELEDEGDPEELSERATMSFGRTAKVLKVSTPTTKGRSRIERAFSETDRRYYHVPCPFCSTLQRLTWKSIRWDSTDDEPHEVVVADLREGRRKAYMECESCKARVEETWKPQMLARGVWIPENPRLGVRVRGYHLSALYAPLGMYSWTKSVVRFLRAKGRPNKLRVWANQDLGEVFRESGEVPEWRRLYELREPYPRGIVPARACLLTAGVDVQRDRLEYEVTAWGPGLERWLVDYVVHPCDPTSPDGLLELDRLLAADWPVAGSEARVRLAGLGLDTGHEAQRLYAWARRYGRSARLFLLKGRTGGYGAVAQPSFVDVNIDGKRWSRGARVWPVDTGVLKEELYELLELRPPVGEEEQHPPGYCHFPQSLGPEYFKGLASEVLRRRRIKSGRIVLDWELVYERNEPLDCAVYSRAAVEILGGSRFSLQDWEQVRALVRGGPAPEPEAAPPHAAGAEQPSRPRGSSPWRRFRPRT